jgi:hypothetical protein
VGGALSDAAPLFPVNPVEENLVGAPDWAGIKAAYRAGKPLRAISEQFGIGKDAIARRVKRDCWQRGDTNTATNARQERDNAAISDAVWPVVAHAVSRAGDDEFNWEADNIVVFHEMPRTAIYWNQNGALVIRQQRHYDDEDVFVFISPDSIGSFIDKLTDFVGIPSVGR